MSDVFGASFKYKLIYILEIRDEVHKGLLKIGDATIQTNESIDTLSPNCKILNQVAKKRIKQYTNTAGISPELLHTELAVRVVKGDDGQPELKAFRDHNVHKVLENSGIPKKKLKGSTSKEWFELDIKTALKAVEAVKKGQYNLSNTGASSYAPVVLRPEQIEAIDRTIKQFKDGNRMLWNAKMRFGKTLSALQVVKKMGFKKTIIITHRPVVDSGWYEDFGKIFSETDNYVYGSKNSGYTVEQLLKQDKNFVYFASIQDLRGSDAVGGKFDKNSEVFNLEWDFVIVDEAHEGTTTALGNDVIKLIVKEESSRNTKFLALSGTPFNILREFDDNIYTWDYVMEQRCKHEWDLTHFGDSNPYDELPELKIFTYDLGKIISDRRYVEIEDKAFNFREFFRVWNGEVKAGGTPPRRNINVGEFYHEEDINSFLNLITKVDKQSNYPYSTEEYRDLFRHSLWMVPGVKEAKALSRMMKKHPIFGNGMFSIVNVAGDGDEEEKFEDALKKVREAIESAGDDGYTITLSCGKLTTGVTVPEWTAVFMLAGSFSTSASNYLQTIFRVQSPCNKNGRIKQCCYVFDFAPDRTLKMIAEAVAVSTRAGKTNDSDKKIMGDFLNYCPVISVDGTTMRKYDTNKLLQQLKRAYADRAIKNGFDDINLYNDELLKLEAIDIEKFNALKGIVGASKSSAKATEIDINRQGFTEEEYEDIGRIERKKKKERTSEEEARLKEIAEIRKQKANAISILRGISIRMPLLIYGADVDINEDITMDKLVDIVDDSSWEEFMPRGVTKEIFKDFIKYYDAEIFVSAGRKIRDTVKGADKLPPLHRIKKIAELFACFKNPDKETVLTPWRVVNMHMSDCLGGYDFFDEDHETFLEVPRLVVQGKVTESIFGNKDAKILEINSKTGLYPLYATYSIYQNKCNEYSDSVLNEEFQKVLWSETVQKNIFVICKTPMAKSITRRTLVGFKNLRINAHYFDDLINMMKNKPENFIQKVLRADYWKVKGDRKVKFDAVISNPPYQQMDAGNASSSSPVYNYFIEQAKKLNPQYISMIIPARWYVGGKGLDNFRSEMLNDRRMVKLVDYGNSQDVFRGVDIAGGVCYFLWSSEYDGSCEIKNVSKYGEYISSRKMNEFDIFIRDGKAVSIVNKVLDKHNKGKCLNERVSSRKPFGLPTNYKPQNQGIPCWFIQKIGLMYAKLSDVIDDNGYLSKWKLLAPKAPIAGQTDFTKPVGFYYDGNTKIAKPGECCTESYIILGAFDTEEEALSYKSYIFTKTVRFLLLQSVASQDVTKKNFCFIPDLGSYVGIYTDDVLRDKWGIGNEEWDLIDSRISNIGEHKQS